MTLWKNAGRPPRESSLLKPMMRNAVRPPTAIISRSPPSSIATKKPITVQPARLRVLRWGIGEVSMSLRIRSAISGGVAPERIERIRRSTSCSLW